MIVVYYLLLTLQKDQKVNCFTQVLIHCIIVACIHNTLYNSVLSVCKLASTTCNIIHCIIVACIHNTLYNSVLIDVN